MVHIYDTPFNTNNAIDFQSTNVNRFKPPHGAKVFSSYHKVFNLSKRFLSFLFQQHSQHIRARFYRVPIFCGYHRYLIFVNFQGGLLTTLVGNLKGVFNC